MMGMMEKDCEVNRFQVASGPPSFASNTDPGFDGMMSTRWWTAVTCRPREPLKALSSSQSLSVGLDAARAGHPRLPPNTLRSVPGADIVKKRKKQLGNILYLNTNRRTNACTERSGRIKGRLERVELWPHRNSNGAGVSSRWPRVEGTAPQRYSAPLASWWPAAAC